ncbi:MAG: ATP-grasp domain-containing protein [Nitrospiria bacterium]
MDRLLLLIPSHSYRAEDFLKAAEQIGIEIISACNKRQTLEEIVPGKMLTLDFLDLEASVEKAVLFSKKYPFRAVVSADEEATVLAAMISEALALPHNPVSATAMAKDKALLRKVLSSNAVPTPSFQVCPIHTAPEEMAQQADYPLVIKPTFLSASRGVIRVNNQDEFHKAFLFLKKFLKKPEIKKQGGPSAEYILVEEYIPGREIALEGLLQDKKLSCLALFDKPDPLDGPYFEETLYITPSRLPTHTQAEIIDCTRRGCETIGLREGPIHAEIRVNEKGPVIIEIAARSIGGLCARTLRFGTGLSLEEIILRHTLGRPIQSLKQSEKATGVMMIPIPKAGILEGVYGLDAGKQVKGIEEITITLLKGQKVIPLPEGRSYLGFIFAQADTPDRVEAALREAHQKLKFDIAPLI